jgi:hypothetical protein
LEDNLYKLDFNWTLGFKRVSKLLNDIHITLKGDIGWVQLFIALPPFCKHEYNLQNLKDCYHFKAQTIIPTCQGIEEIKGNGDLNLHVIVTLPSLRSMLLRAPFGSCRQPLTRSRG